MASTASNTKQIVTEIPTYLRVFNDGTVERPRQAPTVPPSLHGDERVSSKDTIISQDPTISARLYLPKPAHSTEKLPILVFFHGGGFFFESAFSQLYHEHFNCVVPQTNLLVVSVDYRLAPEHPLPACYHDCWAALQWVASHAAETEHPTKTDPWLVNHGDFSRIFIGGDSAGGNIVHNPRPEQALPAVIWDLVYPSAPGGLDNPMINPVGPGAPSLAGLGCSKMIVFVAGMDNIRDRGVWYYDAVKKSGWQGKIDLFEQEGEDHVYHIFHPESESSKKLIKRLIEFLDE